MVKELRDKYNSEYSEENYQEFINDIRESTNNALDFKVCETPLFIDLEFSEKLQRAANSIADFLQTEEFKSRSINAVPRKLTVPNEDDHPLFLQIDFAVVKNEKDEIVPQLIELQGFPSLYAFQAFIDQMVRKHFNIPNNLTTYFNELNYDSYVNMFKESIVGDHETENVVLLEIEPDQQKTVIDFFLTEKLTGVAPVCVTDVKQKRNKLFYKKNGREIKIDRIYSRVIFDELLIKKIKYDFNFMDDLDVEWAGHPNWFFRISKYSLPLIKSEFAPECYYLKDLEKYPVDLDNYVLKPLFSFAGSGVKIDLNKEVLDSITDPENYILQKKVNYEPVIRTPDGYSKAEIRMMFLWNEKPFLVNNLLRTSKGKMMGVDYNVGQTWIGANIVYHP